MELMEVTLSLSLLCHPLFEMEKEKEWECFKEVILDMKMKEGEGIMMRKDEGMGI
jgi:hypothetical protein